MTEKSQLEAWLKEPWPCIIFRVKESGSYTWKAVIDRVDMISFRTWPYSERVEGVGGSPGEAFLALVAEVSKRVEEEQ